VSALVEIDQLGKSYPAADGSQSVIVRDFSLDVADGEFVCLLGHSGCGKTTVLSIVMGLNTPTTGGVVIGGREVAGPGTDRGVVFQSATLLPWLSVRSNVTLALDQVRNGSGKSAETYLDAVGLGGRGEQYPRELSAGMQQRVGIARAFALEPRLLLLDEPFSLLDALTRMELQDELITLWERTRRTVIMVTHDVDEALLLADRIIPLSVGPAATLGPPVAVPIPRPRDRKTMNHDARFKAVRNQVIEYLLGPGRRRGGAEPTAAPVALATASAPADGPAQAPAQASTSADTVVAA